jgi:hypothetical protein
MIASTEGILDGIKEKQDFAQPLRVAARIISYLFHPLFVPIYVCLFFLYEARLFPDKTDWQKTIVLIQFFIYYTLLPLMTVLLSRGLGFVSSVQLKTQRDRIIPFIVCEIFYFWAWYVFKNLHFHKLVVMFGLAVFLACSLGLILNSFLKISMHAISVGVVSALLFIAGMTTDMSFGIYICIGLLMAGLTATARLIDSNHTEKEIYMGFFVGVLCQLVAYYFV